MDLGVATSIVLRITILREKISDTIKISSCESVNTGLPECPKRLGEWKDGGKCISIGSDPTCGPGVVSQERECNDGTGNEICVLNDTKRNVSCEDAGKRLQACPKSLGDWRNEGKCIPTTLGLLCGPGKQLQKRSCFDGSGMNTCTDSDVNRKVPCKEAGSDLPECPKTLGKWKQEGECVAFGGEGTCGEGYQNFTRECTDGTGSEICTNQDRHKIVSCKEAGTQLPDCPKILGRWRNAASCDTDTQEKSCGPGSMFQTRDCDDGTTDRCTRWDKKQYVRCNLADCPKKLGNWTTSGNCESIGEYDGCGEGKVSQTRTCVDGTSDKCSTVDTARKVDCTLPSCYTRVGDWKNAGTCNAVGNKKGCGPGTQKQTRPCTDGVVYKCTPDITLRSISCTLPDCPKELGNWINEINE